MKHDQSERGISQTLSKSIFVQYGLGQPRIYPSVMEIPKSKYTEFLEIIERCQRYISGNEPVSLEEIADQLDKCSDARQGISDAAFLRSL